MVLSVYKRKIFCIKRISLNNIGDWAKRQKINWAHLVRQRKYTTHGLTPCILCTGLPRKDYTLETTVLNIYCLFPYSYVFILPQTTQTVHTLYLDRLSRPIVSRHAILRFYVMFFKFDQHLTATCCIQGLSFKTFKEILQILTNITVMKFVYF